MVLLKIQKETTKHNFFFGMLESDQWISAENK